MTMGVVVAVSFVVRFCFLFFVRGSVTVTMRVSVAVVVAVCCKSSTNKQGRKKKHLADPGDDFSICRFVELGPRIAVNLVEG